MPDKKTLVTIIILLALFLPAAILGTYRHFTRVEDGPTIVDDNPNKELIYNDKVYFYSNNQLLATFDCTTCSEATTLINDEEYHTNYYKYGNMAFPTVISNNLGMIKYGEKIAVYSFILNNILVSYDAVKNYNVDHETKMLIVKDGNYWGALQVMPETLVNAVPINYDYIALPAHIIDGKLSTTNFIAKRDSRWYLLNNDGTTNYPAFTSEIVDFNNNYVILYDGTYHIYDYNNQEYLANVDKKIVLAIADYVVIVTNSNMVLVYNDCSQAVMQSLNIPNYTNIHLQITDNNLEFYLDGNLYQSVAISQ